MRQETIIDVRGLIDERPFSSFQIGIVVLCALAAMLDGIDTQSIAIAAPAIVQTLGTGQIMPIMGIASLVAAAFVVILGVAARRSGPAALGTAMPG